MLAHFFFEDHIGNKCTIVCYNVSISSVNIIYMRISLFAYALYTNSFMCMCYNVLPNKLTHSQCLVGCHHSSTTVLTSTHSSARIHSL